MFKKNNFHFTALILCILCLFAFKPQDDIYDKINRNLDLFGRIYKEISLNYVDEVNPDLFMRAGIEGMLSALDPYTTYIDENNKDQIELITNGRYGGIGITIGVRDTIVTITEVMNGYEAQRKGLRIGDRIVAIEGKRISQMRPDELRNLVRGAAGSTVVVRIEREGEEIDFELTREQIILKNVSYHGFIGDKGNGIGYLKLDRFTSNSENEVETVLKKLRTEGMKSLIFDLRGNGGGLLDAAIGILNKMVPKNSLLLITKGKTNDSEKKYFSNEDPIIGQEIPIVVLIDHNTASASEVVAGALQDLDRAVIVGSQSFGKGLVQNFKDLNGDAQLKITTSRYFTPSGRWIQSKDYFKENAGGVFTNIHEYNRVDFKTLNGRNVTALGGIKPDIEIDEAAESSIYKALLSKDMFFKFTDDYIARNPGVVNITVDGSVFESFKSFLQTSGFEYESQADKNLNELLAEASKSGYSSSFSAAVETLRSQLPAEEAAELENAKQELISVLQNEMNKRLIEETEQIKASFITDKQLQQAVAVISDLSLYNSLLQR